MKNTIAALLFVFTFFASAQNFQPGYLITLERDTVAGEINAFFQEKCEFKNAGKITFYGPSDIWGFTFSKGKSYKSISEENSFLEVLLIGQSISLYKKEEALFIDKTNEPLQKLEEVDIKEYVDGVEMTQKSTRWRGVLSYLVSDCPSRSVDISKMKFQENEVINVVKDFNECKQSSYTLYKKKYKPTFRFGAMIGQTITSFKVIDHIKDDGRGNKIGGGPRYLEKKMTSNSLSFGLSFVTQFSQKVGMQIDAISSNLQYSDSYAATTTNRSYEEGDIKVDYKTISIPISIVITIPSENFSINLRSGLNFDQVRGSSSYVGYTEYMGSLAGTPTLEHDQEAFKVSNENVIGSISGIEFIKQVGKINLGASIRYYIGQKIEKNDAYSINPTKLSFSLVAMTR